jgi:hypothetical protein
VKVSESRTFSEAARKAFRFFDPSRHSRKVRDGDITYVPPGGDVAATMDAVIDEAVHDMSRITESAARWLTRQNHFLVFLFALHELRAVTKRNGLGKFVRALDLVELFFDCLPELKIVTLFQNEDRLRNFPEFLQGPV